VINILQEVHDLANKWDSVSDGTVGEYRLLLHEIRFLSSVFEEYTPCTPNGYSWEITLSNWLLNGKDSAGTDEDLTKALLSIIPEICFVSRRDKDALLDSLYSSYSEWVLDEAQIPYGDEHTFASATQSTLFTSVTESFDVGEFMKKFGISDQPHRYNWQNNRSDIIDKIKSGTYRFLVIFEDFIGSGSQIAANILNYWHDVSSACNNSNVKILLSPSILNVDGHAYLSQWIAGNSIASRLVTLSPAWKTSNAYIIAPPSMPKKREAIKNCRSYHFSLYR
jgi:hypothetical protein